MLVLIGIYYHIMPEA